MTYQWKPYADLVVRKAVIYTMDKTVKVIQKQDYDFTVFDNGYAAVKDGIIIAAGEGCDESLIGPDTTVVDADGQTLMPGMIDSHMHAMFAAMDLKSVALEHCRSREEMLKLLQERDSSEKAGRWIKGAGFYELAWEGENRKPNRFDLDSVSKDRPIFIKRLCCHVIVANSKALELAGITRDTPDPDGAIIGRLENGEPDGILYENAAMDLIESVVPPLTKDELVEVIEEIGKYINSVGLTTVIDCNMTFDCMRAYLQAYRQGRLTYRDYMMFYLDKAVGDIPYHLNRIYEMPCVTGFGNDMVALNGIKITLDGVPTSGTAYMRKNYRHMPETRGYTTITPKEMKQVCQYAEKYDWQVGVHTIGDAAMDVALDAFEAEGAEASARNRNYLIHACHPQPDMIPKLQEMNTPVTIQPTIMGQMGDESVLFDEYLELNQPAGLYFNNSIICGGSSDYPVVDCNPFIGMSYAMTRMHLDGKVHGPQHKISARQALLMWTVNSAYITGKEDRLGSIEPGKLADMILVDTPTLEATPEEVMRTKVLRTWLGGKLVYEKSRG